MGRQGGRDRAWDIQIPNCSEFLTQFMHAHEIECCVAAPPKFALQPREPIAMPGDRLGISEPSPDLDNVPNSALAERADNLGMLRRAEAQDAGCAVGALHG